MRVYSKENFVLVDPVLHWCRLNSGFCRWSDIEQFDQAGVFAAAREFDLNYGIAASYGDHDCLTIGSGGRSDREFTDAEMSEFYELISSIHDILETHDLKPHQTDALSEIAAGKTYDEACEELGISRTALKNRLTGARASLGATTNAEAVRMALDRGFIDSGGHFGMGGTLPAWGPPWPEE